MARNEQKPVRTYHPPKTGIRVRKLARGVSKYLRRSERDFFCSGVQALSVHSQVNQRLGRNYNATPSTLGSEREFSGSAGLVPGGQLAAAATPKMAQNHPEIVQIRH